MQESDGYSSTQEESAVTPRLQPVQESERIEALDVLRGFALVGIFMVNMQFFAMPLMHAAADPALAQASTSELASWFFVKVFCEYKFISLFSLLFGMGLIVQMMRAEKKGRPFAPVYLRRTALLALLGLLHTIGLWYGDILFIYACISLLLFALRRCKPRTLLTLAGIFVAVNIALNMSCLSLQLLSLQIQELAPAIETPEQPLHGWEAITTTQFNPALDIWSDAEVLAYRDGPFIDALAFRTVSYGFAFIAAIFGFGWHVLVMFVLGAALMKLEFFTPERRPWHKKMMVLGLLIGLPLELASAGLFVMTEFDPGWLLLVIQLLHEIGSYALCLCYLGTITLLVSSGALRWLTSMMANVGRTALSNYIGQTLIATYLMYWWGMGWFGEVSRPQMIGLVIAIYAGQLVVSTLWLRIFCIGPLEWLWRSLTYWTFQPLRR